MVRQAGFRNIQNIIVVMNMLKKVFIAAAVGVGIFVTVVFVKAIIFSLPLFSPVSIEVLSYTDNSNSGEVAAQDDTAVYYFDRSDTSPGIVQFNKVTGETTFFATDHEINSIAVSSKYIFYQELSSYDGLIPIQESHMIDKASGTDTKLESDATGLNLSIVDDKLFVRDKIADESGSISNSPDLKESMDHPVTIYKDYYQTERDQIGSVSADILGFRYSYNENGFAKNPDTIETDHFYLVDQVSGLPIQLSFSSDDVPLYYHNKSLYVLDILHRGFDNFIRISSITGNTKQCILSLPDKGEKQNTAYSYEYYKQDGQTTILLGHLSKSSMAEVSQDDLLGDTALGFDCSTEQYSVLVNTSAHQRILYCDTNQVIYWDNGDIVQIYLQTNQKTILYHSPKIRNDYEYSAPN